MQSENPGSSKSHARNQTNFTFRDCESSVKFCAIITAVVDYIPARLIYLNRTDHFKFLSSIDTEYPEVSLSMGYFTQ